MNSNIPPSLGFKKVYREAPLTISLVLPEGTTPPSTATVRMFYNDVLQDIVVTATVVGLVVSWTFSVIQLRAAVGKRAKFDILFGSNPIPVCGNDLLPVLDYEIPANGEIFIRIGGVGDTRVVFTGDIENITAQATLAINAASATAADREAVENIFNDLIPLVDLVNETSALSIALEDKVDVIQSYAKKPVPAFLFNGESNSRGYAPNTSLTSLELAPRPSVNSLNISNSLFEIMDIPINNVGWDSSHHGWENGIANIVSDSGFLGYDSVYIVKTGQGGSVIDQWIVGGSYETTMRSRIAAAKSQFETLHLEPMWFILYSQGINDGIAGTNVSVWKKKTIDHIANLRSILGYVPLYATLLMPAYEAYNVALRAIAEEDPLFFVIDTTGADIQVDGNHWGYDGMKLIASRMLSSASDFGVKRDYENKQLLSILRLNTVDTENETIPDDPTGAFGQISWGSFAHTTQVGDDLVFDSTNSSSGALMLNPVDPRGKFAILMKMTSSTESDAVVFTIKNSGPTSFTWDANRRDICAFYCSAGKINIATKGSTVGSIIFSITQSLPAWIKVVRDADDLVYLLSTDNVNFDFIYRQVGALSGMNVPLYFQGICPAANASKKLKAYVAFDTQTKGLAPVTWTNFSNTSQVGEYLTFGTSGVLGALGGALSTSDRFEVVVDFMYPETDQTLVVFLDSDNTASFTWDPAQSYLGGVYHNAGALNLSSAYSTSLYGAITGLPCKIMLWNDGTDLVYSKSYDNGVNYTEIFRDVAKLASISTVYLKCLCASAPTGKRIRVYSTTQIYNSVTPAWRSFVAASQPDEYLTFSTTLPAGALAGFIFARKAFQVLAYFDGTATDQSIVVYLDNDNTIAYDWVSGNTFVGGVYYSSGTLVGTTGYSDTPFLSVSTTVPFIIKIFGEGNDLVYSRSTDAGATYTELYRHVDRLISYPLLYLKCLCASSPTGKKIKIKVSN